MFCAGSNPHFFRYAFPLNSDDFSVKAFFLQSHFMLIFSAVLRLIYHLIFRDISLKSQETFVYFSVMFHLIFSEFYLFNLFSWAIFKLPFFLFVDLFVYLFVYNYFVYLFVYFFIWIFICSFISFSFVLPFWAV